MEKIDIDGTTIPAFRMNMGFRDLKKTGSGEYKGIFRIQLKDFNVESKLRFLVKNVSSRRKRIITIWKNDTMLVRRTRKNVESLSMQQTMLIGVFSYVFLGECGYPLPNPFIAPSVTRKEMQELADFIR